MAEHTTYLVAGTRPNFMKIAPIRRELDRRGHRVRMVHTGQHYDASMSDLFFQDLGMPKPDLLMKVGGGSHAEQTAAVLTGIEKDLLEHRPSLVVVVGDVTSTMAASLSASKLGIPVAHVESGLRSRDWRMPEEINRILTDQMSDLLLIPSEDARGNLLSEGIEPDRIVFVGNVMIDSLHWALQRPTDILSRLDLKKGSYAVATLHRPANVDSKESLVSTLDAVEAVAQQVPVVFPVHPRTTARAAELGLKSRLDSIRGLLQTPPIGYNDFVTLESSALLVATDSGGIQEETTALGVPCLTMRGGTERPVTVTEGTNTVVGLDKDKISHEVAQILAGNAKKGRLPQGWDGKTAQRIVDSFETFYQGHPKPKTDCPRA